MRMQRMPRMHLPKVSSAVMVSHWQKSQVAPPPCVGSPSASAAGPAKVCGLRPRSAFSQTCAPSTRSVTLTTSCRLSWGRPGDQENNRGGSSCMPMHRRPCHRRG
jgi:hypothetical protein